MNIADIVQRWAEANYSAGVLDYGSGISLLITNGINEYLYSYINIDLQPGDSHLDVYAEPRYGYGDVIKMTIQFGDPELFTKMKEIIEKPL